MKIKNIMTALLACAVLVGATTASAAEDVAEEATLAAETVTLTADITATDDGKSALEILTDTTIEVNSDVTLMGARGGAGIYVAEGVTLTIKGSGTLTAIGNAGVDESDSGAAGIGGTYANGNCGNIVIDGATVIAKGYGRHGAGIGSGFGGISGEIVIKNGANVTAQGGHYVEGGPISSSWGKKEAEGGAGIGGGSSRADAVIGDITIENSTVVAKGGQKAAGIGAGYHSGCGVISIIDSNVTATGGASSAGIGTSRSYDGGAAAHARANAATIIIEGSIVNAVGGDAAAGIGTGYDCNKPGVKTNTTIDITLSEVTAVGGTGGAGIGGGITANTVEIEITDSEIKAEAGGIADEFDWFKEYFNTEDKYNPAAIGSGANEGKELYTGSEVAIDKNSKITVAPAYGRAPIDGIAADNNDKVTIDNKNVKNAAIILGDIYFSDADVAETALETEKITVVLEAVDTENPGEALYDIKLVSANDKIINRLNSADLTFALTADAMTYEIIAINEEIAVNPVEDSEDRYEFHYEGKTGVTTDTSSVVTIGRIKITGYGEYTFSIASEETNEAHTTTFRDNIVTDFIPNGAEGKGILAYGESASGIIYAPTQKLTVNIDFPNEVEDNTSAYQAMTVKVTGTDIDTITIALGEDTAKTALTLDNKKDSYYDVNFADGEYVVEIVNALTANTAYTVEVSGLGYRTARYTVNTQEADKTLTFWNNVKDNDTEVEEGKATSAKKVTYLAGDIVKDSIINIYDLSAVVSYFGEEELNKSGEANAYAKYDLNRDGKIDSKDVAYVLVSWDK